MSQSDNCRLLRNSTNFHHPQNSHRGEKNGINGKSIIMIFKERNLINSN